MKGRVWLWPVGIVAVLAVTVLIAERIGKKREDDALREQLRLARQEGIPTTAVEFAAQIKPVPPEQNAAQFYRELGKLKDDLRKDLADPYPVQDASLARDKKFVAGAGKLYNLVDQATKRPHCWFDRDWNQGYMTLFPEYAYMKSAARLLMIRGSVEASEGDSQGAAKDVKEVFAIGRHLDEDPTVIAYLVHVAVTQIAVEAVTTWSMKHRNEPLYRELLADGVNQLPKPDMRRLYSGDLYCLLSAIDKMSTRQGRREFGLKDDDGPSLAQQAILKMASRGKGKPDIVKAFRAVWSALPRPMAERDPLLEKAGLGLDQSLMAFPYAYEVIHALGGSPMYIDLEALSISDRQRDIALLRAISQNPIPPRIKTSDLLSPYDGKPLSYSFDGKQIRITTSAAPSDEENPKPRVYKTPPDSAFEATAPSAH
jgi:hypothetical protein